MSIIALRVALTPEVLDRLVTFYRDGLGLAPGDSWTDNGRGQILNAGQGVLEILNTEHAASVDQIEVGQRVSTACLPCLFRRIAVPVFDLLERLSLFEAC